MIETLDETTTLDQREQDQRDEAAADRQAIADAAVTGECRCLACESLIPQHAIRAKALPNADDGSRTHARCVHLYCAHCDLTYELVQVRVGGAWTNSAMTAVTDRATKAKVARDMAAGQGIMYVDRSVADPSHSARLVLIARLERAIARMEQELAEARGQHAAMVGVTPAEADALGVTGRPRSEFPFVSGDMRHLMGDGADEADDYYAHG
jgi:hypothetical protein